MKHVVLMISLAGYSALAGCQNDDPAALQAHQAQQRADLAAQQERDRAALAQHQAEENARVAQQAQQDLAHQTAVAQQQQAQASAETARLNATIAQACTGIEEGRQMLCPVAPGDIVAVRDVDHGVDVQLRPSAGTRDVIRSRVDCYHARETALNGAGHPAPAAAPGCLMDVATVHTDVRDEHGNVTVALTSTSDAQRDDLRTRAHALAAHASR